MAITITVASAEVDATLTDFPVWVDLSNMPASFWSNVSDSGTEIRVLNSGGTRIPAYVSWLNKKLETGSIFFLADSLSSSSDTTFDLDFNGSGDAAYDRDNVWADYEVAHPLDGTIVSHSDETPLEHFGGSEDEPSYFSDGASNTTNAHDGVAVDRADPTYAIGFDETQILKFNTSWTQTDSNTDPGGDAGLSGYFLGAGCVYDGTIYTTLKDVNTAAPNEKYIALYDASDLSFIKKFEITDLGGTGVGVRVSGLYYDPEDDLLYAVRFNGAGDDQIIKYDPSAETHDGSITMSSSLTDSQGIVKWRGVFWITNNSVYCRAVLTDGTVTTYSAIDWTGDSNRNSVQNVTTTFDDDGLLVSESAGTDAVHERTVNAFDLSAGGGLDVNSLIADNERAVADLSSVGAVGTSWLMSFTFRTDTNNQDALAVITSAGSGAQTDRAAVTNDDGDKLGVFDTDNDWLYCSPNLDPDGTGATYYRCAVYYDGTTERAIYYNGSNKGTDSTITARGSAAEHLALGSASADSMEASLNGALGLVLVRTSIPTNVDEWVAAEYSMLNDNATFLSISGSAGPTSPAQPTLTITGVSATGVSAETSAFSPGSTGTSHQATQWRIKQVSDGSIVYNPGDDASNLTSIVNAGSTVPLDTASNVYTLEARHLESS